eukprot:3194859-Pyramimonas_sp.AAC.1
MCCWSRLSVDQPRPAGQAASRQGGTPPETCSSLGGGGVGDCRVLLRGAANSRRKIGIGFA